MTPLLFQIIVAGICSFLTPAVAPELIVDSIVKCCTHAREVAASSSCEHVREILSQLVTVPHRATQICNYVGTVCCENALTELHCSGGINKARTDGVCSDTPSDDFLKCCELCKTGILVGRNKEPCDLHAVVLGQPFETAYMRCCETENPIKEKKDPTGKGEIVNLCELYHGELCQQGCISTGNYTYKCFCKPGYFLTEDGQTCKNRCPQCPDGCEEIDDKLVCTCREGFYLADDNVTCLEGNATSVKISCPKGYETKQNDSKLCYDIDECEDGTHTCKNETEICFNYIGSYTCLQNVTANCSRGYHYHTYHQACEDINECAEIEDPPCDSNQDCHNTPGGYNCTCKKGFKLDPITMACMDVNECQQGLHNCGPFQRCDNTLGSFLCVRDVNCGTGYTLNTYSNKCEDDDECALGTDNCRLQGPEWECRNTVGSFRCVRKPSTTTTTTTTPRPRITDHGRVSRYCPPGYSLQGYQCVDDDECALGTDNCRTQGPDVKCKNILGSYRCVKSDGTISTMITTSTAHPPVTNKSRRVPIKVCPLGYTLRDSTCFDDDECALGTHACKLQGPDWECRNIPGSYTCERRFDVTHTTITTTFSRALNTQGAHLPQNHPGRTCPSGFRLHGTKCVDIDECSEGTAKCNKNQRCVNIQGDYFCPEISKVCENGFRLNDAGTRCVDINECEEQPNLCMHRCFNKWGSYRCVCNVGYNLGEDNSSCIDVNECELGAQCQGYCQNEPGSYICQCPPGYRLSYNRHSCIDIDECQENDNLCDIEREECVNVAGAYRCAAVVCPVGYKTDPASKSKCVRDHRCESLSQEECVTQPSWWTFNFISMVSNLTIPRDGLDLYILQSSLGPSVPEYTFELKDARAAPGTEAATQQHFYLMTSHGKATLQLVKPLFGPQDISIALKTVFVLKHKIIGSSIHNIEIFVSQYTY